MTWEWHSSLGLSARASAPPGPGIQSCAFPHPFRRAIKKSPFKTIKRIPPGTHPSRTCSPRPTCCLTHTCRMRTGHTRSTCFKTCFCAIRVEINSTSKIIAGKPKILLSLIGGILFTGLVGYLWANTLANLRRPNCENGHRKFTKGPLKELGRAFKHHFRFCSNVSSQSHNPRSSFSSLSISRSLDSRLATIGRV